MMGDIDRRCYRGLADERVGCVRPQSTLTTHPVRDRPPYGLREATKFP